MDKKSRDLVMAKLYLKNKDYKMAEKSFSEHLNMNPDDINALKLLAQVYEQTKRFDKAFEAYERCYLAEPDRTGVLLDICRILLINLTNEAWSDIADHRKWLNLAMKAFPSNPIVTKLKSELSSSLPVEKETNSKRESAPPAGDSLMKILDELKSFENRIEQRLSDIDQKLSDLFLSKTSLPAPLVRAPTPKAQTLTPLARAPTPLTQAPTSVAQAPTSVAQAPTSVAPAPTSVAQAPTSVAQAPTSVAPTFAPTSVAPTFAPTSVAPTFAPTSVAPTFAPTSVAPTFAPIFASQAPPIFASQAPIFASLTPTFATQALTPVAADPAPVARAPTPVARAPTPVAQAPAPVALAPTSTPFGANAFSFSANPFADSLKKFNLPTEGSWVNGGGFSFSSTTQNVGKSSTQTEDDDNDVTQTEELPIENTCNMQPIEIKTGEEEEEVLFEQRCKLFRFRDKEYKERGVGNIKVLRHRETGNGRLIMRRDQIGLVCLNCWDCKKITLVRDTQIRWFAIDASDADPQSTLFIVKFKTKDSTDKFLSYMRELFADNGHDLSNAASISGEVSQRAPVANAANNTDNSASEIELVSPQLDPTLVDKARKLQLPDLFYHKLPNQEPCVGCDGCEKEE